MPQAQHPAPLYTQPEITLSRNAGRLVASSQTTEYFFDKTRTAQEAADHCRKVYPNCALVLSGEVADEIEPAPSPELSALRICQDARSRMLSDVGSFSADAYWLLCAVISHVVGDRQSSVDRIPEVN